jgi:predicted phosphoribosyltransferase
MRDRLDAGRMLAEKLVSVVKDKECIILAIPRGGVVVGAEIARILGIPLDVVISKKITPPDYPEYAIGAITYDGVLYRGHDWERHSSDPRFEEEIQKKKAEVTRQIEAYRGNTNYELENKTAILVDDGIATGATVHAILQWLQQKNVKEIILTIPVIPYSTYEILKKLGVQIIALEIPTEFSAVAQFYREFDQVSDQIVLNMLQKYKKK